VQITAKQRRVMKELALFVVKLVAVLVPMVLFCVSFFFISSDDSLFVYDCVNAEKAALGNKG